MAKEKNNPMGFLLDTKGPEIRTAMLRGGKDIYLDAGQEIFVHAAGDDYTSWEGYKEGDVTKIGLSYAKLCSSVKPGSIILIADGAISIEVVEILDDKELKGRVVNSNKLGQRKNCNLPGVLVELPVLGPKDVEDVRDFACKNDMDFIAASFVQSPDDVKYIRKVLTEGGKPNIRIISKIENEAGLRNIDGRDFLCLSWYYSYSAQPSQTSMFHRVSLRGSAQTMTPFMQASLLVDCNKK